MPREWADPQGLVHGHLMGALTQGLACGCAEERTWAPHSGLPAQGADSRSWAQMPRGCLTSMQAIRASHMCVRQARGGTLARLPSIRAQQTCLQSTPAARSRRPSPSPFQGHENVFLIQADHRASGSLPAGGGICAGVQGPSGGIRGTLVTSQIPQILQAHLRRQGSQPAASPAAAEKPQRHAAGACSSFFL